MFASYGGLFVWMDAGHYDTSKHTSIQNSM